MATLVLLCSLALLAAILKSSAIVEKQPALDATNADIYQQLLGRVENLEKRDQDQQAEIETLRSELHAWKERTSILEGIIASLGSDRSETIDDDEGATGHDLPSNKRDSDNHRTDSEQETDRQSSRIVRRQSYVPVVAFHATLRNDQPHTGVHQAVLFENVITNIGGAYHSHLGAFVAPVPGVYVFYTKILGRYNHAFDLSIVRNGATVALLYIRDVETIFGQDSAMVVLHLSKGDDVAVQCNDADKFIRGGHYSMFSGFLLHEDVPTVSVVG